MNPHVSDEQIKRMGTAHVDLHHGAAMRSGVNINRDAIVPRGWSYMDGMYKSRDLYEPLVTSQKERIAALEAVLESILEEYDDDLVMVHTPIAYFKKFDAARDLLTPKTTDPK